jgi:hypothetical protein
MSDDEDMEGMKLHIPFRGSRAGLCRAFLFNEPSVLNAKQKSLPSADSDYIPHTRTTVFEAISGADVRNMVNDKWRAVNPIKGCGYNSTIGFKRCVDAKVNWG